MLPCMLAFIAASLATPLPPLFPGLGSEVIAKSATAELKVATATPDAAVGLA